MIEMEECPICFEHLSTGKHIFVPFCKHKLCLDCAIHWYIQESGNTCVCCRQTSHEILVTNFESLKSDVKSKQLYIINSMVWNISMSIEIDKGQYIYPLK